MSVQPSEELAYWVGVAQSDGSLKFYTNKHTGAVDVRISLHVATKSLPMVRKFQEISIKIFNRRSKIWKERNNNEWDYHIGAKKLLSAFKELDIKFKDPPRPPKWCLENRRFFGAYLAGLIDGDGSVRNSTRYRQLRIKITSGKEQAELAKSMKKILNCSIQKVKRTNRSILKGKLVIGKSHEVEFDVSSKNYQYIRSHVAPHITLKYKKEKIENYIKSRWPR